MRNLKLQQLRRSLKAIVTWPPLNLPVTSAVRATVPARGREWPGLARYLPRVGVVEAQLPRGGVLRMWSQGDDDIAPAVFWRGWAGHEPETAGPFFEWAATSRVTLDIGAHVGYFSLLAAIANPNGRVLAFEPLPRVRDRLNRNIALNELHNVSCVPMALGSHTGTAEFFHVSDGIPSSSSLSQEFMESIVDSGRLVSSEVNVTTVDLFVRDADLLGTVDLVKLDTENTEDQVFQGMVETLGRDRPTILCEVLQPGTGEAIEEIVRPFGYQFFLMTPAGPIRKEHIRPDPAWRNFSFVAR